ncbi:MAG: pentapeptide repeat-containing protein [Clostridiales bacterium]|nr:pentapeptide repeat-containing protein [Clostridiales bacterium]
MGVLEGFLVYFAVPCAQNFMYERSKSVYRGKFKSLKKQFENVISTSVISVSERLDERTKLAIIDALKKKCQALEEANVVDIVSREFLQSGVENADPQIVASEICVNFLDELCRFPEPELRACLSFEILAKLQTQLEKGQERTDKALHEINRELKKISSHQHNDNMVSSDLMNLLKGVTQNEVDCYANALYIPDEFKNHFDKSLFLEKQLSDGKQAKLKDVYISNSFDVLDFPLAKRDSPYPDIVGFICDFINNKLASNNYHLPYSFSPDFIHVLFIKGLPGSGKSSLFYHLAKKKAYDSSFFSDYTFYFVKLIDVYDAMGKNLSTSDPLNDIEQFLGIQKKWKSKTVLVLDGLDEICVARDLNIEQLCNNLIDSATSRRLKIIITTRLNYVNISHEKNKNVINLQLYNLTPKQLGEWCDKYFAIHDTLSEAKECAMNNITFLEENLKIEEEKEEPEQNKLTDIFAIPLLFYMITVSKIDVSKLGSIGELYDAVFSELQNRNYDEAQEDFRQKPRISKLIPSSVARQIAVEIAFKMYTTSSLLLKLKSDELKDAINKATEKTYSLKEKDKQDIEMLFPITFFYKDSVDVVEFAHKSIMEFFTAEKLYQQVFECDDFDSFINKCIVNPIIISVEVLWFFVYFSDKDKCSRLKETFPDIIQDFKQMIKEKKYFENKNVIFSFETSLIVFKIFWFFIRTIFKEDRVKISGILLDETVKKFIECILSINSSNSIPLLDNSALPYDFSELVFSKYSFSYCQLDNCDFNCSELIDCKFDHAKLRKASFVSPFAIGELVFDSCDMYDVSIHLRKKPNEGVRYYPFNVKFISCNLYKARFVNMDISEMTFESITSLDEASMTNVTISLSQFMSFLQFTVDYNDVNVLLTTTADNAILTGYLKKSEEMSMEEYLKKEICPKYIIHPQNDLDNIFNRVKITWRNSVMATEAP